MWKEIKTKAKNIWIQFKGWIIFGILGTGIVFAMNTQTSEPTTLIETSNPEPTEEIVYSAIDTFSTTDEIISAQVAYFEANGEYLQVIPGNKLSPQKTGTVEEKLGKNLLADWRISTYKSPDGSKGFFIRYEEGGISYSVGYGKNSKQFEYERVIPPVINDSATASST